MRMCVGQDSFLFFLFFKHLSTSLFIFLYVYIQQKGYISHFLASDNMPLITGNLIHTTGHTHQVTRGQARLVPGSKRHFLTSPLVPNGLPFSAMSRAAPLLLFSWLVPSEVERFRTCALVARDPRSPRGGEGSQSTRRGGPLGRPRQAVSEASCFAQIE